MKFFALIVTVRRGGQGLRGMGGKAGGDEAFYAVVLPDGTVIEPQDEKRV